MNRSARTNYIGAKLLEQSLTPDARDWVIAALDPFHDFQRQLAGYPDTDCSNTTVACYQFEKDVTAPVGAPGNWDSHIFTMPITTLQGTCEMKSNLDDVDATYGNGEPTPPISSLNIVSVDAGQVLAPKATASFTPTHLNWETIDTGSTAGSGVGRIIAWGIEIVNTTAEMYKQGALTAYRLPQMATMDDLNTNAYNDINQKGKVRVVRMRAPPSSPAEAMLLGGTVQWSAADGIYMVVPMRTTTNPLEGPTNVPLQYSAVVPLATGQYTNVSSLTALQPYVVAPGNAWPAGLFSPPQKYVPFNTVGVMLTGLSPQSSFRVKMKMYVEKAPSYSDTQTAILATPSAAFDARALELYGRTLSGLPVGVPVSMNAFGDWFKIVLDTVASVAPMAAAFGPQAGMIGGAAAGVARTISNAMNKPKIREETKGALKKMKNDAMKKPKKQAQKAKASKVDS